MWKVSVDGNKTTVNQQLALDGIYGNNYFPRKVAYKKDAERYRDDAKTATGATLKIERA
jgi:hypothetical protein